MRASPALKLELELETEIFFYSFNYSFVSRGENTTFEGGDSFVYFFPPESLVWSLIFL